MRIVGKMREKERERGGGGGVRKENVRAEEGTVGKETRVEMKCDTLYSSNNASSVVLCSIMCIHCTVYK